MSRKIPSIAILVISALGMLTVVSEVQRVGADGPYIGVDAGKWIKYDVTIAPPPTLPLPVMQWFEIEFISVEAPKATVRLTTHTSSGMEGNATITWDVTKGGGFVGSTTALIIPANSQTGHSVFMMGYGNVTIAGETTRTYSGASRTAVYTSYVDPNGDINNTYYWDKETGVMLERNEVGTGEGGIEQTATIKVAGTNIWQAQFLGLPIDPAVFYTLVVAAIAIVVGVVIFAMRRKKKPPEVVTPPTTTSQTTL